MIRLVAADPAQAARQLSRWRLAQILSHPNLLRVFDTGRCRLTGQDLIFGVMEYADENLAQIIPERPLTIDEGRQMLEPTLEALAYLHGQGLVHGRLTPANVLAIGNEIKLASDWISPVAYQAKEFVSGAGAEEVYEAPEAALGKKSAASDVWSLGMILSEALTQHLPVQNGSKDAVADPRLPENFPAPFLEIVRGCLRHDPDLRWTVDGIASWLHPERAREPATSEAGAHQANLGIETRAPQVSAAAPSKTTSTAQMPAPAATPSRPAPPKSIAASDHPNPQKPRAGGPGASATASLSASSAAANRRISTHSLRQPPVGSAVKPPGLSATENFLSWTAPLVRRFAVPAVVAIAALGALYAAFGLLHRESSHPESWTASRATTAQQPAPPTSVEKPRPGSGRAATKPSPKISAGRTDNRSPTTPSAPASPVNAGSNNSQEVGVAQQVMPTASESALATIQGTVRVSVKIRVDAAGNTTGVELSTPGPSAYFARLSQQAAQQWKFDPSQAGRSFLLHFEFRNSGIKAYATRTGA